MAKIQNALMRLTGLDTIIQKEVALRAQVGGLQMAPSSGDELTGPMAQVEEALSQFNTITRMHRERTLRYRDYDAMDNYGDISVALDIFAEEATQVDLVKKSNLWFEGDEKVIQILEPLIQRLRMRSVIYGFARQIAKYGDMFIMPRYAASGIESVLYLPPDKIRRIGPSTDKVKHYRLEDQLSAVSPRKDGILLPWECVHFRILTFGFSVVYGRSMIESSRKRWLHLKLLEDSVAIYRLNRAVERLIFYIDVGQASPAEALRIVQQYKRKFGNKRNYLDPSQAQFEQQYDPTNMFENIFWPVNSANERSRIDKLQPPPDQGQLQDLDHFNQKLYVALGIPKDFITGDVSGAWNSRESLSLQDIRFSRKIERLQLAMIEGVEMLCRLHLAVVTGDAEKAKSADFKIHFTDISKVARQQYDQILLNRGQLMLTLDQMGTQMQFNREVWLKFILQQYFPDIPDAMIPELVIPDAQLANQMNTMSQAGQQKENLNERLLESMSGPEVRKLVQQDMEEMSNLLASWEPAPETVDAMTSRPEVSETYLQGAVDKYHGRVNSANKATLLG